MCVQVWGVVCVVCEVCGSVCVMCSVCGVWSRSGMSRGMSLHTIYGIGQVVECHHIVPQA